MDDGDGALTIELQAFQVAKNALNYRGSHPCPACGIIMNPVEYMYTKLGVCPDCGEKRRQDRINRKMV
jgi:hypothetical protein